MTALRKPLVRGPLRLGFGCSGPLGARWFSDSKAERLVRAALDAGVTHFDTAGFYAEAERRLGAALRNVPDTEVFVSTKIGTRNAGLKRVNDFSDHAIRADVEASLRRLGRERLDLVYLHGPGPATIDPALRSLETLRTEGKIAHIGLCSAGQWLEAYCERPEIDVFMASYNIFFRAHAPVLTRVKARGKSVVAISPLAQALYRTDFFAVRRPADLWRVARALTQDRTRIDPVRRAARVLEEPGWSPSELALAFVLNSPFIDVAVSTTSRLDHLQSLAGAATRAMPDALYERLAHGAHGDAANA